MSSISTYIPLLELISAGKVPEEVISDLPKPLIDIISEISLNILYGSVTLTSSDVEKLKKVKRKLIKLADQKASYSSKQAVIGTELIQILTPPTKLYLNGGANRN